MPRVAQDGRTPRPSAGKQLRVLVHKQLRVEAKQPGNVLLRTILGPIMLVFYGLTYLSSYNSFADTSGDTVAVYDDKAFPLAAFSVAQLVNNSDARVWVSGEPDTQLQELVAIMDQINEAAANATAPDREGAARQLATGESLFVVVDSADEAEFKAACANATADEFFAGMYLKSSDPWHYSIMVEGSSAVTTSIHRGSNQVFQHLEGGVIGVQRIVDSAILLLEGAPLASARPLDDRTFATPMPRQLMGRETPWFLAWLPGFYINIGVMFMLNFYITPLIVEKRQEVVRQFVLLGVRQWVYWMHWIVIYSMGMVLTAALFAVVFLVMKYAPLANPFLVFCSFFLNMVHFAIFCTLVPYVVSKEEIAAMVPFLCMLISGGTYALFVNIGISNVIASILTALLPFWGAFQYTGIYIDYDWAGRNVGVNFANAWESGLGLCFVGQILGIVLYLLLVFNLYAPPKHKRRLGASQDGKPMSSAEQRDREKFEALPATAEVVLRVRSLAKQFGKGKKAVRAVDGLDMDICKDEVYGFLGHNGAGKTTALSMFAGEIPYAEGAIEYHLSTGMVDVGAGHDDMIRQRIGVCPQHDILFSDLTCREHLELFAKLKGGIRIEANETEADAIDREVGRRLSELRFTSDGDEDKPVGTYSGGMKRKVSIAVALLGDPEIVFLDEPTAGMDPFNRRVVWEMVAEAKKGRSIVLTTHFMDEADVLSDRIGIINKGRLVASGTSLFLKHKFGAGYTLTYTCPADNDARLRKTVADTIPDAIFLDKGHSSRDDEHAHHWTLKNGSEPHFPALLRKLEEAGCSGVSVDLTTLEQVFLKTGAEGHSPDEEALSNADVKLDVPADAAGLLESIWADPDPAGTRHVSWFRKVMLVANATAKQGRRNAEAIMLGTFLPSAYIIGAFVAGKFLGQNAVTTPSTIPFTGDAVFVEGVTADTAGVFGISPTPADVVDARIEPGAAVPDSLDAFWARYHLGGMGTLSLTTDAAPDGLAGMPVLYFNSTATQALPVLINAVSNWTLAAGAGINTGVRTDLVRLPYVAVDDFPLLPFLMPMFLGFGFLGLAFVVIDLSFYKEYQLYSVFRLNGITRTTVYVAVALQTMLFTFVPFFITALALGFGLQSPLLGSGGRAGVFVLIMFSYLYAVVPISMMFEPLFPDIKAAKNWFPFIWVILTVVPFVVLSTVEGDIEDEATRVAIADGLSVIPPMAFQRAFRIMLQMSSEYDDPSVTFESLMAWDRGVSYCIVMLLICGTAGAAIVVAQVRHAEASHVGGDAASKQPKDEDVIAERARAFESAEGINVRDLVKRFRIEPNTSAYKFRVINPFYWLQRIFLCRDPFAGAYGTKEAVKGLSFGIKRNEIFVLLGPNGSGKTVTTKCLIRDLVQDGGQLLMGGQEDASPAAYKRLYHQGCVAYCPQFDSLFPALTVKEHLYFAAGARGLSMRSATAKRHVDAVAEKLGLTQHLSKPSEALSGGYKRKLSLAMAIIGYPKLAFFDEISTGVDPGARHEIWSVLKPEADGDELELPAVLLSTHYMDEAQVLASRVGIMIDGEMITTGSMSRLQDKHCSKNYMEATFAEGAPADAEARLLEFFTGKGLKAEVHESMPGRVKLEFPVEDMSQNTSNLARLFTLIEGSKESLSVEYYSLSVMNLEQIFIALAKRQFEIDAEAEEAARKLNLRVPK